MTDPALIDAIGHMHDCGAKHVETVHVHEKTPNGSETVWEGDVEVFKLVGLIPKCDLAGTGRASETAVPSERARLPQKGRCYRKSRRRSALGTVTRRLRACGFVATRSRC
jgi:hypothetical protein